MFPNIVMDFFACVYNMVNSNVSLLESAYNNEDVQH